MRLALALLIASASTAWIVLSAPSMPAAGAQLSHIFIPATLLLGAGGLAVSLRAAWRYGWCERVRGITAFSFLALTLGLEASRTAVRHAGRMAGYPEAFGFDDSVLRIATAVLLVAATAAVMRWLTKPALGELGWAIVLALWAAIIVLEGWLFNAALLRLYLMMGEV